MCGGGVEGREGRGGEWLRAMTRMGGGSKSWAALDLCAGPTCEAAENPSPVSSGVLVTVKSMVYSNKGYSVFWQYVQASWRRQ